MDVVFINAVAFSLDENPHIGQFILRDILKDKYNVTCINFDLLNKINEIKYSDAFSDNIEMMGNYILGLNPKVVGFYTICNCVITSVKLAEFIKNKNPNLKIIFGGPHASVTSDECLEAFDFLDCICIGESEYSITPLIDSLIHGKSLELVSSIAFKDKDKIIKTNQCELVSKENLPKYTVYDYSPFEIKKDMLFPIEGGRGCPFNCTFCTTSTFWHRTYRVKSVDALIGEMKYFYQKYGVYKFMIHHDMFTMNRSHIVNFCNHIIDQKLPFEWRCSSRVDVLDEELIDLMKESNCVDIFLGIETGSEKMQKNISKNLNLMNAEQVMRYIVQKGINATASFMYCFPDEKIDDFKLTIKMIESCIINGIVPELHRFVSTPGTPETNKIIDRMYFDRSTVVQSHNNVKLDKDYCELILSYPKIFSQYYTFKSDVGERYGRFNLFLDLIIVMRGFFEESTKILIKKFGMEKLYFMMEKDIEEIYCSIQSERIDERLTTDFNSKYNKIYSMFRKSINMVLALDNGDELLVSEIFTYEDIKYRYFTSRISAPKIHKFKINMEAALGRGVEIIEDYYIRYYFNEDKLFIQRVIPKVKLLNEI